MASMVLEEMARGDIPVLIGRAPEFYGAGKTQSVTNALVIDKLKAGKKPKVPLRDDTRRTLIWTPDASRALATLGNTPDAFGQTWHLPCCDDRPTYRQFVDMASNAFGRPPAYSIVGKWAFWAAGLFSPQVREIRELLPRYEQDNLFDSTKFKQRFLEFRVTTYREGLALIRRASQAPPIGRAESMTVMPSHGYRGPHQQSRRFGRVVVWPPVAMTAESPPGARRSQIPC